MVNCVVPTRERKYKENGDFDGLCEPAVYRVNTEELPELCARGVMPMRFLKLREDYEERFLGCDEPRDVNDVLLVEGYWREVGQDEKRRVEARIRKRRSRAAESG